MQKDLFALLSLTFQLTNGICLNAVEDLVPDQSCFLASIFDSKVCYFQFMNQKFLFDSFNLV